MNIERALLEVVEALAGAEDSNELFEAASRIAQALDAASVAILGMGGDPEAATLLAASDDPDVDRIDLRLQKYPEVRAAIDSGEPVSVPDVSSSPLLGELGPLCASRDIGALLAFPMLVGRRAIGVLLVRFRHPLPSLDPAWLRFGRMAASAVAVALRAGPHLEALRERTRRQKSVFEHDAERRRRAIDRYRDFLDSATDGMVVVDEAGAVLYLNHAAEAMTGYSSDGLAGKAIAQIVPERHRDLLALRLCKAVAGDPVPAFDLDLVTTSGDNLAASVTSIGVLAEHKAAIFSFRDVTLARELEAELRQTKEFLERILNAAVDAVIACDMRGRIVVYNPAAERLFGHRASSVVGKMSVSDFYPPGGAAEVMRLLRAPDHGGAGRLEPVRREILNANGEMVPIQLSAAIVYDDAGRELATVGISTDLRERIRIEQRLASAQQKLATTERETVAVEVAGAAAHELNQPLTSVLGYAEMLRKKLGPESPHLRLVETIHQEAERMAAVVKRIGSLARYETKAYVGGAQIIDLERSSSDTLPVSPGPAAAGGKERG